MSDIKQITHHIGGKVWDAKNANLAGQEIKQPKQGDVFNPATGQITGKVDFASVELVDYAIEVATTAQAQWRDTSLAKRTQVIFAIHKFQSNACGASLQHL